MEYFSGCPETEVQYHKKALVLKPNKLFHFTLINQMHLATGQAYPQGISMFIVIAIIYFDQNLQNHY